jgi:glycerate 2-kinase
MQSADHKKITEEIFYSALRAVDPYSSAALHTDGIESRFRNGNYKRLLVTGFGKAVCPMSKAIEDRLSTLIDSGTVITKYGHCEGYGMKRIRVLEAGHPVPDENGVQGTGEIIDLLKHADEESLVVCLISGGGSALLVSPYEGISLSEKQEMTRLLLKAGADINELNCVRKHISRVKGGRLAEFAYPAGVISLILSDVIGDSLDVIASGPTAPDGSTFAEAFGVLRKYGLTDTAPESILEVIQKGRQGLILETPKGEGEIFRGVKNIIIGSNGIALEAAKANAVALGFHTEIISSGLTGEARSVGKWLAEEVRKRKSTEAQKNKKPLCLISGGETTVTVKGNGTGGRNTELALAFAMEIEGMKGITLLSAGTDGTDGPTDAAGAVVDGDTISKAKSYSLDPDEYLRNNDSYNFFRQIDDLFITGPTGTNVMDLQIIIVE